jgi:hypothetical protein
VSVSSFTETYTRLFIATVIVTQRATNNRTDKSNVLSFHSGIQQSENDDLPPCTSYGKKPSTK